MYKPNLHIIRISNPRDVKLNRLTYFSIGPPKICTNTTLLNKYRFRKLLLHALERFPATRRKSLIKKLKRKYFSNVDRVFTENINAGLAYFEIKKCIKPSGKSINRKFKIWSSVLSMTTVKFNNVGLIFKK